MHCLGYAHRDLKPENLLLLTENDITQPMLIDFGYSKKFIENNKKIRFNE